MRQIHLCHIFVSLKGKQEASGYPAEVKDQESREKYIRDDHIHEGNLLDAEKKLNPTLECLNCLSASSRESNPSLTALFSQPKEFFGYMFSEKYKLTLTLTILILMDCPVKVFFHPPHAVGSTDVFRYRRTKADRFIFRDRAELIES